MRYRLNTTNYHDFSVYERGKLRPRSYFIPYPDRAAADAVKAKEKRYRSSRVRCLNGDWEFKFYPRPAELPTVLDTEQVTFDAIDVPSCWQYRGYDRPFYLNVRYQFPYKPPQIPTTEPVGRVFDWIGGDHGVGPRWKKPEEEYNFVGVYRKKLEIDDETKGYVISFLGVASCLDLYCNGRFVGYSEGAHNTAEFDLTGKLHMGENELLCVVHRWCNGTYLECQDMFRNNGIFRDVLLRVSEPTDITDIDARTEKTETGYRLTLWAKTDADTTVTFTLAGHGITSTVQAETKHRRARVCFEDLDVTEWNAETPTLYDLYYETPGCCVKERIGFKTVEIRGDVFLLNGQKLKLHGVNHHDTHPQNGYCMTPDEIERDLLLCKEFNIDTIRTSHYPPDPLLLELADELGIYIIDENDLETHGVWAHVLPPSYDRISDDPKWSPRYLDRIRRLYGRDKLHSNTCIVMWSLGNEAGGYRNTDLMYDWLKQQSALPVHYESVIHDKRVCYDVGSEMYPPAEKVRDVGEHRRREKQLNDRPYFLCEYAHAMGVGPGNMEAYWQEIYQYDNLMGGCVWEMVDHAVLHEDGSYTYGGDHGEWCHDGNFCVDGIFYPDRSPSTGAWIVRHVYRPIRVRHWGRDDFEIFNTTAFSPGSRYELQFLWSNGDESTLTPDVQPLCKAHVQIPHATDTSLIVRCSDRVSGRVVSEEQVILAQKVPSAPETKPLPEECEIKNGSLQWKLPNGTLLTTAPQGTLLYRVGTDNDTNLYHDTMEPLYNQKEAVLEVTPIENGVQVLSAIKTGHAGFLLTDTYEGVSGGILVTSRLHCVKGKGTLPRFGKSFRLDVGFDAVEYVGRTGESYCDMKQQFPVRRVQCRAGDMTEPNLRPQESGNRCDCTEAALSDGQIGVQFMAVDRPFELAVKPYTDLELTNMRHREDEKQTGVYVTIQAFQQGVGTASCGPGIAPEFTFDKKRDYTLQFLIRVR